MNRREFLRRATAAALMATPAMQAAALVRDFGVPGSPVVREILMDLDLATGPYGMVVRQMEFWKYVATLPDLPPPSDKPSVIRDGRVYELAGTMISEPMISD